MKTCPDCGERVYNLGCVNCNEAAYIEEQIQLDAHYGEDDGRDPETIPQPSEPPNMIDVKPFRDWELSDLKRFISAPREDPTVNEFEPQTRIERGRCPTCGERMYREASAPVVAEVRRAPLDVERRTWLKIRTWLVIQSRHRAGESAEDLATDYNVPVEWVRFVLFPENDLDARYGRPSDRVKTSRERAEKAEAELAALRTRLRGLEQQFRDGAHLYSDEHEDGMYSSREWQIKFADELARLLTTPEEKIK